MSKSAQEQFYRLKLERAQKRAKAWQAAKEMAGAVLAAVLIFGAIIGAAWLGSEAYDILHQAKSDHARIDDLSQKVSELSDKETIGILAHVNFDSRLKALEQKQSKPDPNYDLLIPFQNATNWIFTPYLTNNCHVITNLCVTNLNFY